MKILSLCLSVSSLLLINCGGTDSKSLNSNLGNESNTLTLVEIINNYRIKQGLESIPVSISLNKVANAHVRDLENHTRESKCNLHSWSDNSNDWTGCCYTSDHARAECMWNKPSEITNDAILVMAMR